MNCITYRISGASVLLHGGLGYHQKIKRPTLKQHHARRCSCNNQLIRMFNPGQTITVGYSDNILRRFVASVGIEVPRQTQIVHGRRG
ncbi:MAG: hypothetical protein ACREOH_12255 [Candidatus Entotheonellia bacterium]